MFTFLHQTFEFSDLVTVALLVVLEGLLSIDNALVLGLLAGQVPREMRSRVLSYGLIGAFIFRLLAIALAAYLLHWEVLKLLGGGYLVYAAARFFIRRTEHKSRAADAAPIPQNDGFWKTVIAIEITDVAFAVDSILAAVALVGPAKTAGIHPKLWVIVTGGMLGVILIRFAAAAFTRLLEKFPRFNISAYAMVLVCGLKLVVEWAMNSVPGWIHVDFQDPHTAVFWIFWAAIGLCFVAGFFPAQARRLVA